MDATASHRLLAVTNLVVLVVLVLRPQGRPLRIGISAPRVWLLRRRLSSHNASPIEMLKGGVAASWFSLIARECAPGPQGRLNRPSSIILLVVGRRRRPIDGH
jgi:hypothetical protein